MQYQVIRGWNEVIGTTSALTFTVTGLSPDRQYEYRIASVNGGGWAGPRSDSFVLRQPQLRTPTGLAVTKAADPTTLAVTWSDGGQLSPWNLYRDGALLASSPTPGSRTQTW